MSSKKFCLVKELDNQNGGFMKYKIITRKPNLIVGPPIINFTSLSPSFNNTPAEIKIIGNNHLLTTTVPLPILNSVTNNIFKYVRQLDPYATFVVPGNADNCIGSDCKNRVKFLIKTPNYSTTLSTKYSTLNNVITMLGNKYYNRGIMFYDNFGKKVMPKSAVEILESRRNN